MIEKKQRDVRIIVQIYNMLLISISGLGLKAIAGLDIELLLLKLRLEVGAVVLLLLVLLDAICTLALQELRRRGQIVVIVVAGEHVGAKLGSLSTLLQGRVEIAFLGRGGTGGFGGGAGAAHSGLFADLLEMLAVERGEVSFLSRRTMDDA